MTTANKRKRSDAAFAEIERPFASLRADSTQNGAGESKRPLTAACIACRKQKIKCDMPSDVPPCVRCQRRSIDCVLHLSTKGSGGDMKLIRGDVRNLFETVERICTHLAINGPQPLLAARSGTPQPGQEEPEADEEGVCELSPPASPSRVQAPIDTYLETALTDPAVSGASPRSARRKQGERQDLLSKRLISPEVARVLVDRYLSRLDHFLYGICGQFQDLDAVRKASPALFAAICTVSAFQDPTQRDVFEVCNKEYRQIISASLFEKKDHNYIRALCVGSFWLPDASRILSSDAVRRSADCWLARSFNHLTAKSTEKSAPPSQDYMAEHRDKVRLWYLLFVCDQHLSVLHNRDCLLRADKEIVTATDAFRAATGFAHSDTRVASQVALLALMSQIRDAFGSDDLAPLAKSLNVQYLHFARELDGWFAKYSQIFEPDPHIGTFPMLGLQLHYQFAKLYLAHHVFRGLKNDPIPLHFIPAANTAHQAASFIFEMLFSNTELRSHLVGVPHYFHIMISFAGHLLMELCLKHREELGIPAADTMNRIHTVLQYFARMPNTPQHPLARITSGLVKRLAECSAELELDLLMAGSPFGKLEGFDVAAGSAGQVAQTAIQGPNDHFALVNSQIIPDDFLYTDFGQFAFNGSFTDSVGQGER